jgi:hypothetical protein
MSKPASSNAFAISLTDNEISCWTVTQDDSSEGDTSIGDGCRLKRMSFMCVTHDGQCIFDIRNEVVTSDDRLTDSAILSVYVCSG